MVVFIWSQILRHVYEVLMQMNCESMLFWATSWNIYYFNYYRFELVMRARVITGRAPIFVLKSVWGCLWYPRTYGTFPISAVASLNKCCPVLRFWAGFGSKNHNWWVYLDLGPLGTAVAGFVFKNWTWWLYKDLDSPYNCFGHVWSKSIATVGVNSSVRVVLRMLKFATS
jgi:hypothetical protein